MRSRGRQQRQDRERARGRAEAHGGPDTQGARARPSSYSTDTHLATDTVSDSPFVTQNCSQALPATSLPLLPGSTLSTVNVLVCDLPSHFTGLRWLCSHAAAALLEPSFFRAASFLPDFDCFRETQSVVPFLQEYLTLSVAAFLETRLTLP